MMTEDHSKKLLVYEWMLEEHLKTSLVHFMRKNLTVDEIATVFANVLKKFAGTDEEVTP